MPIPTQKGRCIQEWIFTMCVEPLRAKNDDWHAADHSAIGLGLKFLSICGRDNHTFWLENRVWKIDSK